MGNTSAHQLLDENAIMRDDIERLKIEVAKCMKDNDDLRSEMRPYQETVKLYRRGLYEDNLKKGNEGHDEGVAEARNDAAHGGDVIMDSMMITEMSKDDIELSDAYTEKFIFFYGIQPHDCNVVKRYKEITDVTNIRATVYLRDRRFDRGAAYYIRGLVDEAVGRFRSLSSRQIIDDLETGSLGERTAKVKAAYQKYANK